METCSVDINREVFTKLITRFSPRTYKYFVNTMFKDFDGALNVKLLLVV